MRRPGYLRKKRRAGAEEGTKRHHAPLPEVIDRWVRNLREALLEVAREWARPARERRERGVVAHGGRGLVGVRSHGAQEDRQLFAGEAGRNLAGRQVAVRRLDGLPGRDLTQTGCDPRAVGPPDAQVLLDRTIALHAAPGRIDGEDLAGAEPVPLHPGAVWKRNRPRFGRTNHEAALDDCITQRTKAVAIERGPHDAAVGEDDAGGPIPWLEQRRVVAVEVAQPLVQLLVPLPRLGNEHGQRMADVAAATDEQLERVVEHGRVGAGLVQDGREQRVVFGSEPAFTRPHPVHVPLDRVDLAVVAEEPERLRALPGRRRVRGEALVEDPEARREGRVAEVAIESRELIRGAERLVRDRAKRERGEVRAPCPFRAPPGQVGAPFERVVVQPLRGKEDELFDQRRARLSIRSERARVDGNLAPAGRGDPLGGAGGFDGLAGRLVPKKDHRQPAARLRQECSRERQEEPGAVPRPPVGGRRSPVTHAGEPREQEIHDLARGPAERIGDEADSASVVLAGWIVECCSGLGRHGVRPTFRSKVLVGSPPTVMQLAGEGGWRWTPTSADGCAR